MFSLASLNASFGYFGGGGTPSFVSTVDRIEYSNDTAAATPKGPLSATGGFGSATGNSSFGYFAGGDPGPSPAGNSRVQRLDYANDTNTAVLRGPTKHNRLSGAGFSAAANANPQ